MYPKEIKTVKMACIELPPANGDSEMEEGEIVDEGDELSDISSEEEFLLRQRLQVLENYNNVLERKQAKRTSNGPTNGNISRKEEVLLCELSEVSENDFEENITSQRFKKKVEPLKPYKRKKQTRDYVTVLKKIKDCKKKPKQDKKKSTNKLHFKSSEDSDDEYFNKRRKLADAVTLKKHKIDTSTLKDRINRMLFGAKKPSNIIEIKTHDTPRSTLNTNIISDVCIVQDNYLKVNAKSIIESNERNISNDSESKSDNVKLDNSKENERKITHLECIQTNETINLCTDNDSSQDVVDSNLNEKVLNNREEIRENKSDASSDEDLELLREYALRTKSSKTKSEIPKDKVATVNENKPAIVSEDEDSDTAELRLICLKSTLLKKAIEIKQKQKLKKRLSQSSFLQEDLMLQDAIAIQSENNTDIESVDMDMGSDGEEKAKEPLNTFKLDTKLDDNFSNDRNATHQDNELEEDEDLLRAKLLTSLSKNLPNLVDLKVFNSTNEELNVKKQEDTKALLPSPEEKKFIIKLGESDSEGEHEATKNLTKMHMKLAEHYQDFQSKLDTLLKSTRMEFEKESDVIQKPALQKPKAKFIPKAMNHLPKSEQVEYKNLVKRMAELEKIKLARNSLMSSQNKSVKETLKLRNTSLNTLKSGSDLEEKFALSRKKIAEESAKLLKLKDEAKKLSQKYKIVATELKNISTAINFNKRQQRAVHNNLQQIRLHHQLLLKGSTHNFNALNTSNRKPLLNKLQKENNPTTEKNKCNLLKSVKVTFVNDTELSEVSPQLSVQLDVANNKKTVKLPKTTMKGSVVEFVPNAGSDKNEKEVDICHKEIEKDSEISNDEILNDVNINVIAEDNSRLKDNDEYKSPLTALGNTTWEEDPNAFLCPYEVGGSCRDPDCKYIHPKIPSHQ